MTQAVALKYADTPEAKRSLRKIDSRIYLQKDKLMVPLEYYPSSISYYIIAERAQDGWGHRICEYSLLVDHKRLGKNDLLLYLDFKYLYQEFKELLAGASEISVHVNYEKVRIGVETT